MNFEKLIGTEWYEQLKTMIDSDYFIDLGRYIANQRKYHIIYPEKGSDLLFKAFRITPFSKVKVVILGQDPYHGENQYDGLAFSNSFLSKPQPSLRNILKEVENDVYNGFDINRSIEYSLYSWAEQGVLLINCAHTVIKGKPGFHMGLWKEFTNEVISSLNKKDNIIWLLWGDFAKTYQSKIINKTHHILTAAHPSPFSAYRGFFKCKHFSKTNKILKNINQTTINW